MKNAQVKKLCKNFNLWLWIQCSKMALLYFLLFIIYFSYKRDFTNYTYCQFNKILKLGLTWMMGRRVSMTLLPVSSIFWSRAHCSNWATLYLGWNQIRTGFLPVLHNKGLYLIMTWSACPWTSDTCPSSATGCSSCQRRGSRTSSKKMCEMNQIGLLI